MDRRLRDEEWREIRDRETRNREMRNRRSRELGTKDWSPGLGGPGGYDPTIEHSDYGFQAGYGAYGDYGGADRFTRDLRDRNSPFVTGESSRDAGRQEREQVSSRGHQLREGDRASRERDRDYGRQGRERDYGYEPRERDWTPGERWIDQPAIIYSETWTISGPYAGRGPLGYRRSDEQIQEDVCELLTRNGDLDASDIEVRVQDGVVELHGNVDRRQDKYLAEDLVESVSGVTEVLSRLRVRKSSRAESYEKKFREERERATRGEGGGESREGRETADRSDDL